MNMCEYCLYLFTLFIIFLLLMYTGQVYIIHYYVVIIYVF